MSGTELKQRLAAILAADERAAVAALDAAGAIFRTQIESNQGRVIDMAGDSALAVFETATGAVSTAQFDRPLAQARRPSVIWSSRTPPSW